MQIENVPGPVGADVTDVDLSAPFSAEEVTRLDDALAKRLVLRFRGTALLAQQLAIFGSQFGKLQPHIAKKYHHPENANIVIMTNQDANGNIDSVGAKRGEGWHSDGTFEWIPPKATVLHSLAIPNRGGNTKFANMYMAYETMPQKLKDRVNDRYGTHRLGGRNAMNTQLVDEHVPSDVVHPLIRFHPETGLRSVFANPTHSVGVVGMSQAEANERLDDLFAWCERKEFQWEQVWRANDTIMWDNRGAWHQATLDYPPEQLRKFIRTTISGVPVMDRQKAESMLKQTAPA
jgi:taurine dioxygenase